MSEQTDQKLVEVAVAQYVYRHDAEFAAGFLDHAAIPYRLQIDDPALGFTVSAPATIWVRAMDLVTARELLEVSGEKITLRGAARVERRSSPPLAGDGRLTVRERVLAATISGGVLWMTIRYLGDGTGLVLSGVATTVAVAIFLTALLGRAPQALKRFLGAMSGSAP